MAKQLYDYWFVQFDFPDENGKPYKSSGGKMVWNEKLKREIPESWSVSYWGELVRANRGISYNTQSISGGGVPMINLASFNINGTYKHSGLKTYNGTYTEDKVLHALDLVMCNTQQTAIDFSKDIIAKAFLIPDIFEGEIVSSHHITTLQTDQEELKPYLSYLTNTYHFHKYAAGCCSGTNIMGLNYDGLKQYPMEVPDLNTLKAFMSIVYDVERRKGKLLLETEQLMSLRDEILPMLLNGQVSVNYHLYAIEVAFCKFKVLIHRTMKEELIKTIIQKMGRSLDYHQQSLLRDTLHECLCEAQITFPEETNLSAEEDNNILVEAFISAKKIEGCSEKTLKYYQSSIHFLLESIRKPIFKVNTNDIRSFLASYQEGRQLSKVTIDNLRRIYSSFFSWLEDEDYITKSPVRRIHKVKTDSLIKETISDEALEMLRDSCTTLRDLAMVDLLASTGMRVGELVNLNIKDVNFQERQCLVFGKGNKEREVYFNARAKIHLQQYLDTRSDDNTALFVSLKSPYSRLSINGIEVRLRKLGTTCDIGRVHPHKFRRTLATMAIDKGMPIEQVQKLLGHVKIDTTLHYAMVNQTNVCRL